MAYTTIDDPSAHFQTALWSGDGSTNNAITNDGNSNLQPDFVWIKKRTNADDHILANTSSGATKYLISNTTGTEQTYSGNVKSFDSNGFTVGDGNQINQGSNTFVGWQWKANGGNRTTFSASGNQLAGGYQANTTAGFSIVDYTGNATNGATFPHGLGATPTIAIIKDRTNAGDGGGTNWIVAYTIVDGSTDRVYLNGTNAHYDLPDGSTEFRADFDSNNVTLGTWNNINASGTHIAYVFTPIQGYSKFGRYTGNNNADGPFVYTGFKPAWVMIKNADASEIWRIFDDKRDTYNVMEKGLYPNLNNAEGSGTPRLDFLSNGFKLRDSGNALNDSGANLIYMAFAQNPLVASNNVIALAR